MGHISDGSIGRVYPLIVPSDYKEKMPEMASGVGTPRMIYDPETGGWLLFFTGWKNANLREVFVAEVDKDMSCGGIRKILGSPPTRDAVNVIYSPWVDGFILLTTEAGPLQVRHMDRGFKELKSTKLMESMQDSGAGLLTLMGGYSEQNPNAALFYPRGDKVIWRLVKRIDDLDKVEPGREMTYSHWENSNDVIDAFRVNDKFGVLVEYFTDRQNWRSRVAMCGDHLAPDLRALSASLPVPFTDGHSNFGHPSFTSGPDGKPKIMFSFFLSHTPPFPVTDYSKQWRHEIWVWELDLNIFDARAYGRMYDKVVFDDETSANPPIYDLMDARKVILRVKHPLGTRVRIKIEESSGLAEHLAGDCAEQEHSLDKSGRIVLEDPLRTLRVASDKGSVISVITEH